MSGLVIFKLGVGVRVELTRVVPFPTNSPFPVAVLEVANHIVPRSVHPHFQGLCVVFALLISIPRGSLTDTCVSHLLWLCYSAESGLITSVCKWGVESNYPQYLRLLSALWVRFLTYIYIIPQPLRFVNTFLKSFWKNFLEKGVGLEPTHEGLVAHQVSLAVV